MSDQSNPQTQHPQTLQELRHHEADQSLANQKNVEELNEEKLESIVGGVNPAVKALILPNSMLNGITGAKTRSMSEILSQPDAKRPLFGQYENGQLPPKKRKPGA